MSLKSRATPFAGELESRSSIEGDTDTLGAEFTFHHQNLHRSTHKITEFEPGKKVVWHTTDSEINFVEDKKEWVGTDITFEITQKDGKTDCALRTSACRRL